MQNLSPFRKWCLRFFYAKKIESHAEAIETLIKGQQLVHNHFNVCLQDDMCFVVCQRSVENSNFRNKYRKADALITLNVSKWASHLICFDLLLNAFEVSQGRSEKNGRQRQVQAWGMWECKDMEKWPLSIACTLSSAVDFLTENSLIHKSSKPMTYSKCALALSTTSHIRTLSLALTYISLSLCITITFEMKICAVT